MTETQRKLFWNEVNLIQKRHALFFPEEQKQYIALNETGFGYEVVMLEGYDMPTTITEEIHFALKLCTY